MDVYNTLRKKLVTKSQLRRDLISSLQEWANRITEQGGWASIQTNVFDHKTNKEDGWSFCFATKWQKTILKQFGNRIACMDSTHNTCTGRTVNENAYLYTIVVRSKITGQGAPAAFMITNSENQLPIKDFLCGLRTHLDFLPCFMMIDCG